MNKKNSSTEETIKSPDENQERRITSDLDEVYQAFEEDNEAKLEELYNKPGQSEEIKKEIGNAGKVRHRNAIVVAISQLSSKHGRIPSAFEIATKTGYSTNTVYKHLNELNSKNLLEDEMKFFTAQKSKWLSLIMQAALPDEKGKVNLQAVKMGLDIITSSQKNAPITNVNTAIQIVLSLVPKEQQEKVKSLIQLPLTEEKTIIKSK